MKRGEPRPQMGLKQLLELQHVVSQVLADLNPYVSQQWIGLNGHFMTTLRLALNAGPMFITHACEAKLPVTAEAVAHMKSWILSGKPDPPYIDPKLGAVGCRYSGFSIQAYLDALNSFPDLEIGYWTISTIPEMTEFMAGGPTIGKQAVKLVDYSGDETAIGSVTYALDMLLDIATISMLTATNIAHGVSDWFGAEETVFIQTSTAHKSLAGEFITVKIQPRKELFSDFTGQIKVSFETRTACSNHHDSTWVVIPPSWLVV